MDADMDLALQALEKDDHHTARALLQAILQEDPDNELAWLWLAEVAKTDQEHDACLQQAHRIGGSHDRAQRGAGLLGARATIAAPEPSFLAPAPNPMPGDVPVSHSVTVAPGSGRDPNEVAVSYSVGLQRKEPAPPAPAKASAPTAPVPGRPGWRQTITDLFAALLGGGTNT